MDDVKQRIDKLESFNRRVLTTLLRLEAKLDHIAERMMTKDDMRGIMGRFDDIDRRLERLKAPLTERAVRLQ